MFKKLLCAAVLITTLLTACGGKSSAVTDNAGTDKINIIAANFPQYDWVRSILGEEAENAELSFLLSNGTDMHSYQPSVEDISKISSCDMFIYTGGESDAWVEKALNTAVNSDMVVINLIDVLGSNVKEEELTEGMQSDEHDEHDDEAELDEHVWLSLKNAQLICTYIAEELAKLDTENAQPYLKNAEGYNTELGLLDKKYREATENASCKTLLFGDRFPFRYLADDYELSYYAPFPGCSAETEASFKTIAFLASKMDALGLKNIIIIENSNDLLAKTIIENTADKNRDILMLDSMQSVTSKDTDKSYISVMEQNLEALKKAVEN